MPQGVEHALAASMGTPHVVRIPLMPQGVEHSMDGRVDVALVRIPLMPQGVEHKGAQRCTVRSGGEDSIDAARR